jgi:hypothetical protein
MDRDVPFHVSFHDQRGSALREGVILQKCPMEERCDLAAHLEGLVVGSTAACLVVGLASFGTAFDSPSKIGYWL